MARKPGRPKTKDYIDEPIDDDYDDEAIVGKRSGGRKKTAGTKADIAIAQKIQAWTLVTLGGHSVGDTADILGVSRNTITMWIKDCKENNLLGHFMDHRQVEDALRKLIPKAIFTLDYHLGHLDKTVAIKVLEGLGDLNTNIKTEYSISNETIANMKNLLAELRTHQKALENPENVDLQIIDAKYSIIDEKVLAAGDEKEKFISSKIEKAEKKNATPSAHPDTE